MGMKGGCSPQNTLRLKHSLWRCKLNIRKFYEGPIAPSDHGHNPNHRSICLQIGQLLPGSNARILLVRKSWKLSPSHATPATLFDLGHDAVQFVDQRVVAMPAQSYD